ncbi:cell cycle regulator of non-homologous end joining isoform X1 [Mycteria americana]|uniref:cell cycle regulator of non-homologous end joining isoform X1 n=1 Tax=Mycteria americana TaxID=33587 RepID=UPI003F5831A3
MAAGARRRLLPAWMGAAGDERAAAAAAAPAPKAGRRQAKAGPRAAAVVYCMNEAELVDVALAVLAEVSPDPRGWGRGPGRTSAAGRAPGRGQGALSPPAPWRPLSGRRVWRRCRAPPGFPGRLLLFPEAAGAGAAAFAPRPPRRALWTKPASTADLGTGEGCPAGMVGCSPTPCGAPGVKSRTAGSVFFFLLVGIYSARKVRRRPGPGAKRSRSSRQHQTRLLEAQPARGEAATTVWLSHPLLTLVLVPTQRGQAGRTLRTTS